MLLLHFLSLEVTGIQLIEQKVHFWRKIKDCYRSNIKLSLKVSFLDNLVGFFHVLSLCNKKVVLGKNIQVDSSEACSGGTTLRIFEESSNTVSQGKPKV